MTPYATTTFAILACWFHFRHLDSAWVAIIGSTVGSTTGAVSGAFVTYKLMTRREYRTAVGKFHGIFAVVLNSLEEGRTTPNLIRDSIAIHETAIAEFRTHLTEERRAQFDQAHKEYQKARRPIEWDEAVSGALPDAKPNLIAAINNLLNLAR